METSSGPIAYLERSEGKPWNLSDLRALAQLRLSRARPPYGCAVDAAIPLVWGRLDPVITARIARKAHQIIPTARLADLQTDQTPQVSDSGGFAAGLIPSAAAFATGTGELS